MGERTIKPKVYLSDPYIDGFFGLFNWIMENFVFFRWVFFKNRPRGNFLLLRSILILFVFLAVYYSLFGHFELMIEGIDIDPVIAMVLATVIGYWYMSGVFHKKSAHCSTLYTDALKEFGDGNERKANLLLTSLATHLLSLDLWAHRSFSKAFTRCLGNAVDFKFQGKGVDEKSAFIDRINRGKLTIREARNLIEAYQDHLLSTG